MKIIIITNELQNEGTKSTLERMYYVNEKAKMLLQELWRRKHGWDDEIDRDLKASWKVRRVQDTTKICQ